MTIIRKQFQIWLDRYEKYKGMILPILAEHEMPEEFIYLAMIESGLNPKAYSKAKASGMWQFIYSTGKRYGLNRDWYRDERRDPEKATHAACLYLKDLYKQFDNWYLALAAYNCGSGRVSRASKIHQTYDFWQMHSLPRETRNYVPYFLSAAIIARNPEINAETCKIIIEEYANSFSKNQNIKNESIKRNERINIICLLYTSPSPRDRQKSRMPSSA